MSNYAIDMKKSKIDYLYKFNCFKLLFSIINNLFVSKWP